jgi:hypothetical protein
MMGTKGVSARWDVEVHGTILCLVEEKKGAGWVPKELGGAQEALEDPQLEQVELPEARERDGRLRRAFEG